MNFKHPTLHVSILALFLVFLAISAGTLTWFNYEKNSEAALEIADELLTEVNDKVMERIDSMFGATFRLAHEATELPQLSNKPDFMRHDVQWFLAESLLVNPQIYSVYVGYADGDFYQVISLLRSKEKLRERFGAPENARLAVRRVFNRSQDGKRVELWQFLDSERRLVGFKTVKAATFDPRVRPWFRMAIDEEGIKYTPFYVFTSTGTMGLTVARRFDGAVPGVFGVDITLGDLSAFFAEQKVGKSGMVFMFDGEGRLSAYPDPSKTLYLHSYRMGQSLEQMPLEELGEPLLTALSAKLKQGDLAGRMTFEIEDLKYIMRITPVSDERLGKQYVAVAALTSDFTESMDETRRLSLIFASVIFLLAIVVAMYFSRIISSPLRLLAQEADEIRRFNLGAPVDITSNIAEIVDLTTAVKTMKSSLSTFGRYVPKALVRQLLLSKLDPKVGGERREMTLLFTDIADFTGISEGMEPEELMGRMSDYLQKMGTELLALDGTIDKFIGDSIMAFWNAPVLQDNHAELACEAALRARHVNKLLNDEWGDKGIPAMKTRFGLHTGEAVVGNVGSDDRMNYTAIGAAVNLASRLEGLNKYYGTEILASAAVRRQVGDRFVFRTVGKVMPKGTTIPVIIYELLGGRPGIEDQAIAVSPVMSAMVERWEKAFDAYWAQRFDEAADMFCKLSDSGYDDVLAAAMKEKALKLQAEPPGDGWDGVDAFNTK